MLLGELRAELARYAKKMYDSHLVQATQGNISVRDLTTGLICVTPSGADYHMITAEDMVVVDQDGRTVEGNQDLHLLLLRNDRGFPARQGWANKKPLGAWFPQGWRPNTKPLPQGEPCR